MHVSTRRNKAFILSVALCTKKHTYSGSKRGELNHKTKKTASLGNTVALFSNHGKISNILALPNCVQAEAWHI